MPVVCRSIGHVSGTITAPEAADPMLRIYLVYLRAAAAGICPVTPRTVQGMAPYPGQARCLALGFWPECFRRLNVKGGQRPFPKETRSALDIEGKHVTIQRPSPDLTFSVSGQVSSANRLTCVKPGRDIRGAVQE